MTFPFSVLIRRVTALQESHAAATRTADAAGNRCESLQEQLDDARAHIEDYRTKLKELHTQSKKEKDQLQRKVPLMLAMIWHSIMKRFLLRYHLPSCTQDEHRIMLFLGVYRFALILTRHAGSGHIMLFCPMASGHLPCARYLIFSAG